MEKGNPFLFLQLQMKCLYVRDTPIHAQNTQLSIQTTPDFTKREEANKVKPDHAPCKSRRICFTILLRNEQQYTNKQNAEPLHGKEGQHKALPPTYTSPSILLLGRLTHLVHQSRLSTPENETDIPL